MAKRHSRSEEDLRRSSRSGYRPDSRQSAGSRDAFDRYSRSGSYSRDHYGDPSAYDRRSRQRGSSRSGRAAGAYGSTGSASQYSRSNPQYSTKAKRGGRGKKIAIGVVCALVVVLVGCGTAFALFMNSVNDSLQGGVSDEERMEIQDVLQATTTYDEPFYMLLIGSDERVDDPSMLARTDTNIVVRVDAPNNTVTMISIPRDTAIEIDGYGTQKFNAAYTYGNVSGVIEEANDLLGIKISHYAMVNFDELVQLVDVIGGVDVNVPERIDDPDAGDIVIEAGEQHLDGAAALVFARSRAYADGDFTRSSNQRLLIEAIIDKVLSLPATDLPGVISSGAKCVTTDMNVNDIFSLATQFQSLGDITVYSCMVPSTTGYLGDVSYVFTDEAGLADIMEVVESGGDPSTVQTMGATESSLYDSEGNVVTQDGGTGGAGSGYDASTYYDPNAGYY